MKFVDIIAMPAPTAMAEALESNLPPDPKNHREAQESPEWQI